MAERKQTIICMFDLKSPRISAFDIHEWLYDQLHIDENTLTMIQIDGIKRHVYLKFTDDKHMTNILQESNGQLEYRHVTGEISMVKLEVAGVGIKRIRIANLTPETSERTLKTALATYGDIVSIQDEIWSKAYRYTVKTGVKIAMIKLKEHLPSQMVIGGQRALISYEGQSVTCYTCGEQGHIKQQCTKNRKDNNNMDRAPNSSWARILQQTTHNRENKEQNRDDTNQIELTQEQQEQQHDQTEMEDPSEDTQAKKTPNDKPQKENIKKTQLRNDDTPPDPRRSATEQNCNITKETDLARTPMEEREKQDWSQQMQQEEEEEASHMIIEEPPTETLTQKEKAPARGNWKTIEESMTEMKEENSTSKPKKLKLGIGNEKRTERQRSRTRQATKKR